MTEKEKMLSGQLYLANDAELVKESKNAKRLTRLFNETSEMEIDKRTILIKELFEKTGSNFYIEPPFRCDYGCHISIGENFYANFDCIILDVNKVTIGNNVFFAPRVSIYTATHPIDAAVRNSMLELGKPVNIGDNVWIGGNTVINPRVQIGDNTIIGSGSVVTRDIPANVIAVGNPCRVLRPINETDKTYWEKLQDNYHSPKS